MPLWRRLTLFAGIALLVIGGFYLANVWSQPDLGRVIARESHADGSHTVTLLSQPYRLDKLYMSMTGPHGNQPGISLAENTPDDETLYITAVQTDLVEDQTLAPISNEFFCHSNLTLNPVQTNPVAHNASFSPATHADWRLFTLVPGRMDVRLPDGFGLPIKAGTRLDYYTMAINQNAGEPDRTIRMKTNIRYRRESADRSIRPLFRRALYVYQQHKPERSTGLAVGADGHAGEHCGESCKFDARGETPSFFIPLAAKGDRQHPGFSCCVENASPEGVEPQFGDENTVHWMVPPGRHQYRSEVTLQTNLPRDTSMHYVTGHLHPFGEWVRLIEMGSGKIVLEITAEHLTDRLGVKSMSAVTSREGIPLLKGRRYELVTQYNNTLNKPIDAMAIVYIYLAE